MPRRALCGRRNLLRYTGGVHRIGYSFHYWFIYLFILLNKLKSYSNKRKDKNLHFPREIITFFFGDHTIKANSHIPCRAHVVPRPCRVNSHMPCSAHAVPLPCRAALIHTCHAAPLPFSDSAVSFVKVRVVAGNILNASPTV
jgi:hypothetical protein